MRKIFILALNSWQENLKNRFYLLSIVFGVVILYASLLISLLAQDQEVRVLFDFGLGLIEILGLLGALYGAATTILKEMETKTIYLILTRPVSRSQYLLGRFLGLMLSIFCAMLLMACLHVGILLFHGWTWQWAYPLAFLGSFLKVLITASLALFLALFSTSVLTALIIAAVIWTLGHFLPELRFLTHRAPPTTAIPLTALSYLIPNLGLLNWRDNIGVREIHLGAWLSYAAAYCAIWLGVSIFLFRRKEL